MRKKNGIFATKNKPIIRGKLYMREKIFYKGKNMPFPVREKK